MDYQKVIVAGNSTVKAEAKKSKKGLTYTNFTVAVNDGGEKATFFPVVAFGKIAEAAAKGVDRGQQVLVEGRIEVNKEKGFSIIASRIAFGPRPAGGNSAATAGQSKATSEEKVESKENAGVGVKRKE